MTGGGERTNWALPVSLAAALALLPFRITRTERLVDDLQAPPVSADRAPLARTVLLFVVDSLGTNAAFQPGWMPRLQARKPTAAWGAAWASLPTITSPGLCGIMSGHRMRPGTELPGGLNLHHEPDSVLARAAAARRRCLVIGQEYWASLFKDHGAMLEITPFESTDVDHDSIERDLARRAIAGARGHWDLVVLHLFDLDPLGHLEGVGGPRYREKLRWVDRTIDELSRLAGPDSITIVTADHGMTAQGTHGGLERDERRVPFILWGRGIRPGDLKDRDQRDIAPTLSAILGIAPPSNSGGWPALEALALAPKARAAALIDLAEQQRRLFLAAGRRRPLVAARSARLQEQARRSAASGEPERAAALAADAARGYADALDDTALRARFLRSLLGLALLVIATSLALAWRAGPRLRLAGAWGLALYLVALCVPMFDRALWPYSSWVALAAAAAVLAVSAVPGLRRAAMSWPEWLGWWLALAGLALPDVIDTRLWAAAATAAFVATNAWRARGRGRWTAPAAFLAAIVFMAWFPDTQMSLARSWLPALDLRLRAHLPVAALGALAAAAAGLLLWAETRAERPELAAWAAAGALPAVAALWPGHPLGALWALAALAALLAFRLPLSPRLRAAWLSAAALAAVRPLIEADEFLFAALAVIVAWGLALHESSEGRLWRGLRWTALGLWSYTLPIDRLSFSHIAILDSFEAAGGWHPRSMTGFVVAGRLLILWAPLLPLLAAESAETLAAGLPALGALSLGGLLMAWYHVFYLGTHEASLLNDHGYESALWAGLLAGFVALAWAALRAADRLSHPVPKGLAEVGPSAPATLA